MFQEVKLHDAFSDYECFSKNEKERKIIDRLSRVNIFIGANNSGKSRMLRLLFSDVRYQYMDSQFNVENYWPSVWALNSRVMNVLKGIGNDMPVINDVLLGFKRLEEDIAYPLINTDSTNVVKADYSKYITMETLYDYLINRRVFGIDNNVLTSIASDVEAYLRSYISDLHEQKINNIYYKRYYIPILRSLKGLSPKEEVGINSFNDLYKTHTLKEYFSNNESLNIFTGLSLYEDVTRLLLGDAQARNKIKEFEQFLAESFFEQEVSIVPHLDSKTLYVKIGDKERPIHDLGDGIQSIIILTYPLFMHKGEDAIFFFEEPETHLHPGYQRLFIETLQKPQFESFQYFMTTHSNHFLDITLDYNDISVYAFNKHASEDKFDVVNVTSVDENVLKLIGARTSSVFLSNCTIWVEGITDRIYIRKYLEIIQKAKSQQFKEDYHFSFVEYAGNNITHWSFLDDEDPEHPNMNVNRLCSKLFLVTDNDGAGLKLNGAPDTRKTKKNERHQKLKAKLNDRYYLLECREIENLLTKEVIKKIITEKEQDGANLDYSKFDKKDYTKESLGKFIEKNVAGIKRVYTYKSDTISDKLGFAKRAVSYIHTYEDLSDEARVLAERIYDFIKAHNS